MNYVAFSLFALLFAIGCDSGVSQFDPLAKSLPDTSVAIRILAWNVESGGNDPEVIATQLAGVGEYDVFALCEVSPRNFLTYAKAVPESFQSVESASGGGDRLQILFNRDRFDLIDTEELNEVAGFKLNDGNHRSPLVVHLLDRRSGKDFNLTVNHLARGNAELREEQASGLREWARQQTSATIAVGDFNFDYSFVSHHERMVPSMNGTVFVT